jgi:asparagine synthase (glutamine-hydrolysing)
MCGIAGLTRPDRDLLSRMLDVIVHRGPDGSGMEVNDSVAIGMRRLAIVDIETGDQPQYSDDRRLALVFNGEIYNAPELRGDLQRRGHRFTTDHSDTEVILRGYEEWGGDVVAHLIGMFAFALWDGGRGELFLARDRLGIKPLYYAAGGGAFRFASEIKALLQDPSVPRAVHQETLHRFLLFRVHDATEHTFFDGIDRLLPGHAMVVRDGAIAEVRRYWNPPVNPEFTSARSDADYAEEFAGLFDRVVRRHLIADVPIGIPLSGGLDSSGVACTVARLMHEGADLHTAGAMHTFSALYPRQSIDESPYIHEIEQRVHSVPHYAYPNVDEFWNEMTEWLWFQEEPTIATAPYAYYSVYRIAKGVVTVMLSGNGGDELMAGYIPYFRAYWTSAVDQRHWLAGVREFVRGFDIYRAFLSDAIQARAPWIDVLSMRDMLAAPDSYLNGISYAADRNLNRRLADDVLKYSTPNLLRYEDKNSMAFSIEARVPFLDHELVEFIFQLPIDQKIKGGWNRAVYRHAMKGRIPEKNRLRRNKIGFTNPEFAWMRARAPQVREIFGSEPCRSRGLYDTDRLLTGFDDWLGGAPGDVLIFWRALVCELWMQRFIDQPVAVHA